MRIEITEFGETELSEPIELNEKTFPSLVHDLFNVIDSLRYYDSKIDLKF